MPVVDRPTLVVQGNVAAATVDDAVMHVVDESDCRSGDRSYAHC